MDPRLTWERVEATVAERTRGADDARFAAGSAAEISQLRGALPDTAAVTGRFASAQTRARSGVWRHWIPGYD
jgi:hypothetical protein